MKIRDIKADDVEHVLNIYAPFIKETVVTFEENVPSVAEFSKRAKDYTQQYPWLVAEADGIIAGYAYASKYRERIAYQWVAECSIYMRSDYKRTGIAKNLYAALFDILQLQGIYRVYAVIGIPHEESTRFHEKMGFQYFATYKNTGYKLGQWRDTGWYQYVLKHPDKSPRPPVPYPQLNRVEVEEIFTRYKTI